MLRKQLLDALLDRLWQTYLGRVEYARRYVELVQAQGGRVVNDHIAFRTLNAHTGSQPAGIAAIERVFVPLGYQVAGSYAFPDTHLNARHYQHPDPLAPKIFISQLEVDELPAPTADAIRKTVAKAQDRLDGWFLHELDITGELEDDVLAPVVSRLVRFFTTLPWEPPQASSVREINHVSQYAAWTLLHGNNVNHFTACINEQNVPAWPDIEATITGLREASVPLKTEIEGEPGSKLRQTATKAVEVDCHAQDDAGRLTTLRWPYAYYELAERGEITDETGRRVRFQGFLGQQAAQLFEMTRR